MFTDEILYRLELPFIIYVLSTRFDEVPATAFLIAVARDQLDVVVVVGAVAHGAHVDAFATIGITYDIHQSLRKTYHLLVEAVRGFAHIVIVFDR